jgi:hypothetical protein
MDRAEKYNKFFIQDNEYLKSDEFKTPQIWSSSSENLNYDFGFKKI